MGPAAFGRSSSVMDLSSGSVFASVSGAAFEALHPTRFEVHAVRS
jgi:hypothetical protein